MPDLRVLPGMTANKKMVTHCKPGGLGTGIETIGSVIPCRIRPVSNDGKKVAVEGSNIFILSSSRINSEQAVKIYQSFSSLGLRSQSLGIADVEEELNT